MNHAKFGASMAINEKPVAEVSDIINSLRPIEACYIFLVIQVNSNKFVADLRQQLPIIDNTKLVSVDEVFVGVNTGLHILLLQGDSGLPAVGFGLLQPSELVEAVSV